MTTLFEQWAGEPCVNSYQLTANGSNRLYYRLEGTTKKCIAAINEDVRENEAFFHFAKEMKKKGINVPEVYAISDDRKTYLQEDLGNVSLYTYLDSRRSSKIDITEPMKELYMKAIDELLKIQNVCRDIDFSKAYPRPRFDRQALQWDMNYFKYYFLKLFHIPFDEELLEVDFQTFIDYLLDDDCEYFMYRDYQSRNIMLVEKGDDLTTTNELYFIDFQGARKGAAEYDLASLLYSSKSDVPDEMRNELLDYYIQKRKEREGESFDTEVFRSKFYGYLLARIMQAMGAYGYRGVIEKKEHFVKSIPFAVNNLRKVIRVFHTLPPSACPTGLSGSPSKDLLSAIPHLSAVLRYITELPEYSKSADILTISIFSFSYRKSIPFDKSGNGGGYVFDCRSLPNPGLYDEYKQLNGRDEQVKEFFRHYPETENYLTNLFALVDQSVDSYLERSYTRLMLNFGCTGGRHRSVYCAEQTAAHLREKYSGTVAVNVFHLEQAKF